MQIKSASWPDDRQDALSEEQMLDYRGGSLPAAAWWAIASLIISNWQDIREGFSDGVSGKPARYKS